MCTSLRILWILFLSFMLTSLTNEISYAHRGRVKAVQEAEAPVLVNSASSSEIEIKKVTVGQIEMAYYTRGHGKPLVMITGNNSTMASWDPALLEALEKNYQLILFDNRGSGLSSDTSDDQTSIPQMADDTAELMKVIGLERASILGWSMGSRIAMQLAIRHPDNVDKLILCAANPGGQYQVKISPDVVDKTSTLGEEPQLNLLFPATQEGIEAGKAYLQRINAAKAQKSIPNDFAVSQQTIDRQAYANGKLWSNNDSNYDALTEIKSPTLLAAGKSDVINNPENNRVIANRIPNAWTAYFEGGHGFIYQDANRFAHLVTTFLEN